jgi:predicted nucleotidyltransferase
MAHPEPLLSPPTEGGMGSGVTANGWEKQAVDEATFLEVLGVATAAMEDGDIPYVMIGGIPSTLLGRRRWTQDIDLFVRPEDAPRALEALSRQGFATQQTFPHWLYKASLRGILVDVIFKSSGDIYLDDEMLDRAVITDFRGRKVRLAPPEDVVVMKAVATAEDTARYWYDALAIIGHTELDWDYVHRRARQHGAWRVLSLLIYAQSAGVMVPRKAIAELFGELYES